MVVKSFLEAGKWWCMVKPCLCPETAAIASRVQEKADTENEWMNGSETPVAFQQWRWVSFINREVVKLAPRSIISKMWVIMRVTAANLRLGQGCKLFRTKTTESTPCAHFSFEFSPVVLNCRCQADVCSHPLNVTAVAAHVRVTARPHLAMTPAWARCRHGDMNANVTLVSFSCDWGDSWGVERRDRNALITQYPAACLSGSTE